MTPKPDVAAGGGLPELSLAERLNSFARNEPVLPRELREGLYEAAVRIEALEAVLEEWLSVGNDMKARKAVREKARAALKAGPQ